MGDNSAFFKFLLLHWTLDIITHKEYDRKFGFRKR